MTLKIHNTLSRLIEEFHPINKDIVKMYVCGPTVYDYPHIGNARSVVVYDILYRLLRHLFGKENILYVRNITDVDDKIITKAIESNKSITEITHKVETDFHNAMSYLGCLEPNIQPRATEHIQEMISIIERLIATKHAYISDNHVYFKVSSCKNYTNLSGRSLEDMLEAVRIEKSSLKDDNMDFVLWKPHSKDDPPSANFNSPWGLGRPGWHIECSAMSYKYLGEDFDIHGGGADLIFPHHTNEIAQSTCAFQGSSFAKYWIHNGFLTVEGQKMSKSLGNFITVQDLIEEGVKGDVIRLLLLSTNYRKPLDFSKKALEDAKSTMDYWYRAVDGIDGIENVDIQEFISYLCDDLNTSKAIAFLHQQAKLANSDPKNKSIYLNKLLSGANFIGLLSVSPKVWFGNDTTDQEVMNLINKRAKAKMDKNFHLADEIRQILLERGIVLEDRSTGETSWRKI